MYGYILFDLDGTLTDPKEGITKSVAYALHYFGIEADPDTLTDYIGPPLIWSFQTYHGLTEEEAHVALRKYRERFKDVGIFENSIFPGIPQMLDELRGKGCKVALATSKPEGFAVRILEHFKIKDSFDVIVGSTMDEKRTDKAEVIEEALRQLGIATENDKKAVLMVGDREHDVIGAAKCGIDCLGVYYGYAREGELEKAGAAYIAQDLKDLGRFMDAYAGSGGVHNNQDEEK